MSKKMFPYLNNRNSKLEKGFSLLELVMSISLATIFIGTAAYFYSDAINTAKGSSLKQTLIETRKAIDLFYKATGRYPNTFDELTSGANGAVYLRNKPYDPIAQTYNWVIVMESGETKLSTMPHRGVYDIRSTSPLYYYY